MPEAMSSSLAGPVLLCSERAWVTCVSQSSQLWSEKAFRLMQSTLLWTCE